MSLPQEGSPNVQPHPHRVIPLKQAPGERSSWSRPKPVIYLWAVVELILITNPIQISSRIRVAALRAFGAKIGGGVIFRPRTRVLFPWNLEIGDDCWIGDSVWFHNQDKIVVGRDTVISQGSFLTTGSHSHRTDMGLVSRPISIRDGVWVTSRVLVLGGSVIESNALVTPGAVVSGTIPAGMRFGPPPSNVLGSRF
jgi:putative colanic acid biosynthesis acetyltransferase WcaF